ncbi:PIR protein [Plasmodium ovale]|uniref:PIR protein n=1 Tax=Plasmodium ovale TaxID=36330 RepID=A0A1D3JFE0_PLAOA|nr:PIR protein [Plasmodium ovale]
MDDENEDYNIFNDFDEYKILESRRTQDTAGYSDKTFCDDLRTKFKNNEDKIINHCKYFLSLCGEYTFMRALKTIKSQNISGIMNYWLNCDLKDIKEKHILESDFYPMMTVKSNEKLKNFGCTLDLHTIKDNDFHNLKTLYDLYDNLYKFNMNIKVNRQQDICKNGCYYKVQCATIYNTHIDKCPINKNSKFCNELEKFRQKYSRDNTCGTCSEVPSLKTRPSEGITEKDTAKGMQNPDPILNPGSNESRSDISFNKDYIIIPVTLCIMLGIFLFLFLFNKFTPLRSILHAKIMKKNTILNNIDEEENKPVLANYETDHISCGNTPYHIAYHSA